MNEMVFFDLKRLKRLLHAILVSKKACFESVQIVLDELPRCLSQVPESLSRQVANADYRIRVSMEYGSTLGF